MRPSFQGPSARASRDGSAARGYERTAPRWLLLGGLLLLAAGCQSGGTAPAIPKFSPQDVAAQILAEYDANKDGALDAKELERCPALKDALSRGLDKNKDGRVTEDELKDRLNIFQMEGMMGSPTVTVQLDGTPLGGATVTLTPEKFLGPSFKPLTGTSDASGIVLLQAEGLEKGVVPYGYYRIEVSKKGAGGNEMLPARYNAQTTLGREVAPPRASGTRWQEETLVLRLTRK